MDEDATKMTENIDDQTLIDIANIKKEIHESGYVENPNMKFTVRVEVEEYNEDVKHKIKIEIHDIAQCNGTNIDESPKSIQTNRNSTVETNRSDVQSKSDNEAYKPVKTKKRKQIKSVMVDLNKLYEDADRIADMSLNIADKKLAVELKNKWGAVQRLQFENDTVNIKLQEVIHKWKKWTGPRRYREAPLLYKCYICEKAWWHLDPFRRHLRSHDDSYRLELENCMHEVNVIAYGTLNVPPFLNFKPEGDCWRCNNPFEHHEQAEKRCAIYTCIRCDDTFNTCTILKNHEGLCWQLLKHSTDGEHKMPICDICRCMFCSETELDRHMIAYHSVRSDLPIQSRHKPCSSCNKRFFLHKLHFCPRRSKPHKCTNCGKSFSTYTLVKLHSLVTSDDVKCLLCKETLDKKCMEFLHYLKHTDKFKIAFKCAVCPKNEVFLDNYSARRHEYAVHKVKNQRWSTYFEKILLPVSYIQQEEEMTEASPKSNVVESKTVRTKSNCFNECKQTKNLIERRLTNQEGSTSSPAQPVTAEAMLHTAVNNNFNSVPVQADVHKENCTKTKSIKSEHGLRYQARMNNLQLAEASIIYGSDHVALGEDSNLLDQEVMDQELPESDGPVISSNSSERLIVNHCSGEKPRDHTDNLKVLTIIKKEMIDEPSTYEDDYEPYEEGQESLVGTRTLRTCVQQGQGQNLPLSSSTGVQQNLYDPLPPEQIKREIKSEPMDEEYENVVVINHPDQFIKEEMDDITVDEEMMHYEIKHEENATEEEMVQNELINDTETETMSDENEPDRIWKDSQEKKLKYLCSRCNRYFPTPRKYILHFQTHGFPYMSCPVCLVSFENMTKLAPHIANHVKQTYVKFRVINSQNSQSKTRRRRDGKYQCKLCQSKVDSDHLYGHWDTHYKTGWKKDNDGDVDNTALKSEGLQLVITDLLANMRGTKKKDCVICLRYFERNNDCKRHLIEHLLADAFCNKPVYGALKCQICHESFQKTDRYKLHMRDHGSLPVYRCDICDKAFSDSSNFTKHKKVHNLQVLICDVCKKKFQVKTTLIKHLQMHESTKPITCQLCLRVSHTESAYKKHLRRFHHRVAMKFKCQYCGRKFASVKERWDHLWLVHNERKNKVDCTICKKGFRKAQDLKAHMITVHSILPARKARKNDVEEFLRENPSLEMEEKETLIVYE